MMSTKFSWKKLAVSAALPVAFLTASATQAQSLQLPAPNEMSAGQYGDFTVYSLDLLAKCAADPRCQPAGPLPVASSAGQIAGYLLITQGTSTGNNYPPLVTTTGDNAFGTPTGNGAGSNTFNMGAGNEPDPTFTGDRNGTWEVQLGTLVQYLTDPSTAHINPLVFLFGNNQDGAGPDQFQYIFATASVYDGNTNKFCVAVFANPYGGTCDAPTPVEPTFYTAADELADPTHVEGYLSNPGTTSFVTMATDFCVDKVTGVSYNIGFAGNANDCPVDVANGHPQGGYYVSNNLGNNSAEFAAYNLALQNFILANYLAHPTWTLSVNVMMRNLTDGGEDIWICSGCVGSSIQVPEPQSVALIGLALALLGFARRRA